MLPELGAWSTGGVLVFTLLAGALDCWEKELFRPGEGGGGAEQNWGSGQRNRVQQPLLTSCQKPSD